MEFTELMPAGEQPLWFSATLRRTLFVRECKAARAIRLSNGA
jgi:hypothetical protein